MREDYLNTYFTAELPPEGLPARFGVITAFNPNGASAPHNENLQADLRLKHCLEQLSLRYLRVTGTSRDGSHQEPGFGVITDNHSLLRTLCRQFEQEAFFWIENGEIYCIAIATEEVRRVAHWSERQLTTG